MCSLDETTPAAGSVRRINIGDVPAGLALSRAAQWNQLEADWRYLADTGTGFGWVGAEGGLAGTAMAWPLGADFFWINMVLVAREFRGHGIARRLMEALLDECDVGGRTAVLDASDMGEGLYRKLGFGAGPRVLRLRGEGRSGAEPAMIAGLRRMTAADLGAVARLDGAVLGAARRSLLDDFFQRRPQGAWLLESPAGVLQRVMCWRATGVSPRSSDHWRRRIQRRRKCCCDGPWRTWMVR